MSPLAGSWCCLFYLLWELFSPEPVAEPGAAAGASHLKHLDHVLTVPLLRHVAQLGSDVNAPADVHVHLHGLLLDLGVQLCDVLNPQRHRRGTKKEDWAMQTAIRAPRLSPILHDCTLDQLCQTTSVLNVPHQGTAFLCSPTTLVGCCCWVGDGLGTHIAHQSLEDNKFCLELLHLHGQLLLAGFSLLGFLSRAEGDVQISINQCGGAGVPGSGRTVMLTSCSSVTRS